MTRPAGRAAARLLLGLATAIVIVALSILPFLTEPWMAFAQGRAEATAWTGYPESELRRVTSSIVSDLVFGPAAFDVAVAGEPVLNDRERAHMRDVRSVMGALAVLAGVSVVILVSGWASWRRQPAYWGALRAGALAVAVGVVALGVVSVVAFDAVFEAFHEAFFPPGTWTFDPGSERLVQLFPYRFWFETAFAVGGVILAGGLGVSWLTDRRRRSLQRPAQHAASLAESAG